MLRSPDPNARRKAVCALDRMTGQRARTTRLLAFALGDPCASVRARAVWALVGVGLAEDRINAKFLDMLNDPSPRVFVRVMQVIGLRVQGSQAAIDAVASFLDHAAPVARRLALDTLADIARPGTIAAERLTPMLQDRDPTVRTAAVVSLRSIFGPRPEFARPVRSLLRDLDASVRSEAIGLLVESGPPTEEALREILDAARRCGACLVTALALLPRTEHIAPGVLDELLVIAQGVVSRLGTGELPPAKPGEVRIVTSTSDDRQQIISAWPALRAWEQSDAGDWTPCDDPWVDLDFLVEASESPQRDEPAGTHRAFLQAIPQRIRQWVMGFPAGHWRLLNASSQLGAPAEDLAVGHSHALLFMLAHLDRFQHGRPEQDWSRAAELIRLRQRDALAALGFPGRESVARLLRKVPPGTCTVANLRLLRKLLRNTAAYKVLTHLPRINAGVLECLARRSKRQLCTWPLLVEMGQSRADDTVGIATVDLHVVQASANRLGCCVGRLKPLRSLAQLKARRDELEEAVYSLAHEGVEFPPPPLRGLAGRIEPLRTPAELWIEGQDMKHCAADHVHDVAEGTAYVYRVVGCEEDDIDRATLMIVRGQTPSGWRVGELRRACNAVAVSPATEYTVQQFLAGKEYCPEIGRLLRGLWFGPPAPDVGP